MSGTAPAADITGLPGLRAARQARGLSQRALSRVSGIDPSTICLLETATRDARPITLRRLAAALNVPPAQLLLGDDYPAGATAAPPSQPPPPRKSRRARPTDTT